MRWSTTVSKMVWRSTDRPGVTWVVNTGPVTLEQGGGGGVSLGETSTTAYRGDRGKTAYDHSQVTGNPHGTTAADVSADPAGTAASAVSALAGTLGNSSTRNVGTTTGTVAAGDDSRITGAVQGDGITDAVLVTQAEYDAIGSPDASTLYVVVG